MIRYSLFSLLAVSFVSLASAQVAEVPLLSNPLLLPSKSAPFAKIDWTDIGMGGREMKGHCIPSGGTQQFCVDTTGLGDSAVIAIMGCDGDLQFGQATLNGVCFTYVSNQGITLAEEQVCVEVCPDSGDCQTFTFDLIIHRTPLLIADNTIILPQSESYQACATSDPMLPDPLFRLQGEALRQTGIVKPSDACFTYTASRFGGDDEVRYLADYHVCLVDTFLFPFRIVVDTIQIPFFDDFSNKGPYPDPRLWADDDAFINTRMAVNPVSIGVATLDGLDPGGIPYPVSGGRRDYLTSSYIDLLPELSSNVSLSFYFQPKGLGLRPDRADSLFLDFKRPDGTWAEYKAFPGYANWIPADSIIPFAYFDTIIPLEYKYSGFQFRFRNKSDLTGAVDQWHIDYVRLAKNLTKHYQDIAFTAQPGYLTTRYTAIPWSHIQSQSSDWLTNTLDISLYNHFETTATANPSEVVIRDVHSGQVFLDNITLLELPPQAPVNQRDLTPGAYHFTNPLSAPALPGQLASLQAGNDGVALEISFTFDQNIELLSNDTTALRNNTVRTTSILHDYYAYDDGTAESAIVAQGVGTKVALQFESLADDSLRAVSIMFPRFNTDVTVQNFAMKIWKGSLNSDPVYEKFFLKPFYPSTVFSDSLNPFTTYVLMGQDGSPVAIPIEKGQFFIGWEQGSSGTNPIPVGFDKNNLDANQFAWQNVGNGWQKFPVHLKGALMIRPVFAMKNHTPYIASTDGIHPLDASLQLYPNPASEIFFVRTDLEIDPSWQANIFNAVGQLVFKDQLGKGIECGQWPAGLYYLTVTDPSGAVLAYRKIAIHR